MKTKEKIKEILTLKYKTITSIALIFIIILVLLIALVLSVTYSLTLETPDKMYNRLTGSSGKVGIIGVHIKGEVKNPGFYEFDEGTRVVDAVKRAGGFADNADKDSVNLAMRMEDEQQITIKPKGYNGANNKSADAERKININTAEVSELVTLPGIGESFAKRIIEYREANAGFYSLEQLMNVKGISREKFDDIKDMITIE